MGKRMMWLLSVLFAAMVGAFIKFFPTGSSDMAAWVQAFGSVLAIAGAIFVADRQHAEDRAKRAESEIARFEAIKALLAKVNVATSKVSNAWLENPAEALNLSHFQHLSDCKVSFESLPLFDIPDPDLVIYISSAPRVIDEFNEILKRGKFSRLRGEQSNVPKEEELQAKLHAVLRLTADAAIVCDKQIERRRG